MVLDANVPLQTEPCPICESSENLIPVSEGTGSVEGSTCRSCNHFFFSRRPCQEWFTNHYQREWIKGGIHGHDNSSSLRKLVRKPIHALREGFSSGRKPLTDIELHFDFCRPFLRDGDSVLEVGAGSGRYLLPFRDHGLKCFAVELSKVSAAACSANRIKVISESIEEAENAICPNIDFLVSNHSLEHHYDPNIFLRFASRVLSAGSFLCVSVPNHARMFLFTELMFILHIHSFTELSLTKLLAKHGFRVIQKLVGQQLRFIAQKDGESTAGPISRPLDTDLDVGEVVNYYETRFAATLFGKDTFEIPEGTYTINFQKAPGFTNPLWGDQLVKFIQVPNGTKKLREEHESCVRTVLLDVAVGQHRFPIFRVFGNDNESAPVFVK
jgi:SAM-dependent methyltransferase